jgi:hypothetical protein
MRTRTGSFSLDSQMRGRRFQRHRGALENRSRNCRDRGSRSRRHGEAGGAIRITISDGSSNGFGAVAG